MRFATELTCPKHNEHLLTCKCLKVSMPDAVLHSRVILPGVQTYRALIIIIIIIIKVKLSQCLTN
jgi:hypothetical protein